MAKVKIQVPKNKREEQDFVKRILFDTKVMERMLEEELFETSPIRIGAEQEFNIVDSHYRPIGLNLEMLKELNDDQFTTELARFNMEANVPPVEFKKDCLSQMHKKILSLLRRAQKVARKFDSDIILTGILPTVRKFDMTLKNLTPYERYKALISGLVKMRGTSVDLNINGIDELITKHDTPLLEACNTGFQVHLQTKPDEFAEKYNIAQAICGPAMAVATYSPLLFGKRLWHETRIALFQQSVDTRLSDHHMRNRSPRVMFGNKWVKKSITEMYKEDIMRFRVLLRSNSKEKSLDMLNKGKMPMLSALQLHNSTVYRWNRGCYGVAKNKPHLRIENRVLPAGPTVLDEMANAALWLGLLNGGTEHYGDISTKLDFDDAKSNFFNACRNGLNVDMAWLKGKKISAKELLKKELIPIAREGLKKAKVSKKDIDKYLGVIKNRIAKDQTGSNWMLRSYNKLVKESSKGEALLGLTACILKNQTKDKPVHEWKLAGLDVLVGSEVTELSVEEFMSMDLITVRADDIIELAATIMEEQHLRYVPVEDDKGHLVGLISQRMLMKRRNQNAMWHKKKSVKVKDVMVEDIVTITPDATINEAIELMRKHEIGCLPVVVGESLVGAISEHEFLNITNRLLKFLRKKKN